MQTNCSVNKPDFFRFVHHCFLFFIFFSPSISLVIYSFVASSYHTIRWILVCWAYLSVLKHSVPLYLLLCLFIFISLFIFMFIYFISFMLLSRDFCILTILVWVFCSCMHGHLCHLEMVLHLLFGAHPRDSFVTDSISSMGNFSFSALSL